MLIVVFEHYGGQFVKLHLVGSFSIINPPASIASREVTNVTERKNQHSPVFGVKEFVCIIVCNILFHVVTCKNSLVYKN